MHWSHTNCGFLQKYEHLNCLRLVVAKAALCLKEKKIGKIGVNQGIYSLGRNHAAAIAIKRAQFVFFFLFFLSR